MKRLSQIAATLVTIALALTTLASGSEKVLHTFTGGKDGAIPQFVLIADSAGNLYGATNGGGIYNAGVIFKLTPTASGPWKETIVYHFVNGRDGRDPVALAIDSAGNLYGIAGAGGKPTHGTPLCLQSGCGTIFRLSPNSNGWTFNLLHAFTGVNDGAGPQGITLDAADDVFVTTGSDRFNSGTIFELVGGTKGSTIYTFPKFDYGNGAVPVGSPIFDPAGNLFGVTIEGGVYGHGAVYELSPTGTGQWTESVIYSFSGGNDGGEPFNATLALDPKGNLVGATTDAGAHNAGVVYELTSASGGWNQTVLYAFTGLADGGYPEAGVVLDSAGNIYGSTAGGGNSGCTFLGCGVVFELAPVSGGWSETVLYSFTGLADGSTPESTPILDSSGNLYGTTSAGGKVTTECAYGCGVVFELPGAASVAK